MAASDKDLINIKTQLKEIKITESTLSEASGVLVDVLSNLLRERENLLSLDQNRCLHYMINYLEVIAQGESLLRTYIPDDFEQMDSDGIKAMLQRFKVSIEQDNSDFVQHIVHCGLMTLNNRIYRTLFLNQEDKRQMALVNYIETEFRKQTTRSSLKLETFLSLISLPMQRLMRYPMMFAALKDYFDRGGHDFDDSRSLRDKTQRMANEVNVFMKGFIDTQSSLQLILAAQDQLKKALTTKLEFSAQASVAWDALPKAGGEPNVDGQEVQPDTDLIELEIEAFQNMSLLINQADLEVTYSDSSSSNRSQSKLTPSVDELRVLKAGLDAFLYANLSGVYVDHLGDAAINQQKCDAEQRYTDVLREVFPSVEVSQALQILQQTYDVANTTDLSGVPWRRWLEPELDNASLRREKFTEVMLDHLRSLTTQAVFQDVPLPTRSQSRLVRRLAVAPPVETDLPLSVTQRQELLEALNTFVGDQTTRLSQPRYRGQKGVSDKLALYRDLQTRIQAVQQEFSISTSERTVINLIKQVATVSHHRRQRTRDKLLGFFTAGFVTIEADSWKHFNQFVATHKDSTNRTLKRALEDSLDIGWGYTISCQLNGEDVEGYEEYREAFKKHS